MTERCRDCHFYSGYTDTCDYALLMYRSRGCPVDGCVRYQKRQGRRRPDGGYFTAAQNDAQDYEEDFGMCIPQPSETPPEGEYIAASCGHEVYEGELIFEDEEGLTSCPECIEDRWNELTPGVKATLMGYSPQRVGCSDE